MKLPSKTHFQRSATLLLTWIILISCSLLPLQAESTTVPAAVPDQTTGEATLASGQAAGTTTVAPAGQAGTTTTPAPESTATSGPYSLAISNKYPFWPQYMMGKSLAARPGKVWMGMGNGIIVEVDAQSGTFGESVNLSGGENTVSVLQMGLEGSYLWAYGWLFEFNIKDIATSGPPSSAPPTHPHLVAIDSDSLTVVRQWDMDSPEWRGNKERLDLPDHFGISPGKIWVDGHVINTQTLEVTPDIPMPAIYTHFAYNGTDWMWMTGDNGGSCDDLLLVGVEYPADDHWCPAHWPFITDTQEGAHVTGPGSPLVLAGDRIWIAGGLSETASSAPIHNLTAYWADMDLAMQETGPLASVPLMDTYQGVILLYAGNTLWLAYQYEEKMGFLYQLDPQTGATINSLDLIGDQGRSIGDIPMSMASEGDNLWILTSRQLLRIKLP